MQDVDVDSAARETGSKAARQIRRDGQVPCVLYSRNTDATPFQMPALQLKRIAFSRAMQRVNIDVNGDSWACILKDFELHPVSDEPLCADFQVLEEGQEISLTVPIRYVGTPFGQQEGGDTQYLLDKIEITCEPADIPEHVEVDVEDLDIGDSLHVYDLEAEDLRFRTPQQQTLVTVVAPFVEPTEDELVEEEEKEVAADEDELAEEGELADTEEGEAPDAAPTAEEDGDFEEDL
ncbi:MAG: 50S ribosomal protein L25 [Bacteroidetes bacterium QS_7_67_15]|nr:MAG: 50S ribosomal protein L25 [Bacteroidetes bacterium QS_7_67_15]